MSFPVFTSEGVTTRSISVFLFPPIIISASISLLMSHLPIFIFFPFTRRSSLSIFVVIWVISFFLDGPSFMLFTRVFSVSVSSVASVILQVEDENTCNGEDWRDTKCLFYILSCYSAASDDDLEHYTNLLIKIYRLEWKFVLRPLHSEGSPRKRKCPSKKIFLIAWWHGRVDRVSGSWSTEQLTSVMGFRVPKRAVPTHVRKLPYQSAPQLLKRTGECYRAYVTSAHKRTHVDHQNMPNHQTSTWWQLLKGVFDKVNAETMCISLSWHA